MDFNLKQFLKLSHRETIGLDIGTSSVRMVQLKKVNSGYAVAAANLRQIPPAADHEGTKQNTIQAIKECVSGSKVTLRNTVCSVSGPEVAVRNFSFPPLKPDEIEGAIHLEAAQVCPFNINDGAIHYQVIPNGHDSIRGIFVAATNGVIHRKVRLVQSAGLDCVLMDADGLALLNCFTEQQGNSKSQDLTSTVILDVGATCTTLAIMADNKLPFVRNMPYAGREIITEIAHENCTEDEIVYRCLFSHEDLAIPESKLKASMARVCQKLVTDINETLRFHTAQEKSSSVDRILVCGGFAAAKGFVEAVARGLNINTILWNPFDAMQCDNLDKQTLDIVHSCGPAMAVAVGLAMRSL